MKDILDRLIGALEQGESAVLCTIIRSVGSAPRTLGARMLVMADGSIAGSVGGGALEGACRAKAGTLLQNSTSFAELIFSLDADAAAEQGMVCGGSVSVLLQRFDAGTDETLALLQRTRDRLCQEGKALLLTLLPRGDLPPRLLALDPEEGGGSPDFFRNHRTSPFLSQYQGREALVDFLAQPGRVYLIGAGHVALATARIAAFVGFGVVVMDDRAEFANKERFPDAGEVNVLKSFTACLGELGPDDYVVIVTRGHHHDRAVLAQALHTAAGYIGMIGSKRKRAAVYASLRGDGFTDSDLARVHCPIGLAIGAETPEEIALSIVAELVQVRAGKAG